MVCVCLCTCVHCVCVCAVYVCVCVSAVYTVGKEKVSMCMSVCVEGGACVKDCVHEGFHFLHVKTAVSLLTLHVR